MWFATTFPIHLVFKELEGLASFRSKHATLEQALGAMHSARPALASGGGEGTRTHDPLVANQVLYQLSYAPGLDRE